jgi:rhamnosyl/mannosyltransferase
LRILHVGKYYPPFAGGTEIFHYDLAREQSRQGMQVASVVHDHERGRPTTCFEHDGIRVWRVELRGRLLFTPICPSWRRVLRRAVEEFQPDLIHFHLPNPSALLASTMRSARRVPWVAQWQTDIVSSSIDRRLVVPYKLYAPFEASFLKRCARIITSSRAYLESSESLAAWRGKCEVISLGVARDRLPLPSPDAEEWARQLWRPSGLRVLTIGRLTYYKGHSVLLEALTGVPDVQLCLVGTGELERETRATIRRLGLDERVRMLGYVDDDRVRGLLTTCDCFCLPSVERSESFGLVLPEAMRYGKPAVASDIPGSGVGWVVEHEQTGLLVPPRDPAALSAALDRLGGDAALRTALGERCAEAFERRFDITTTATKIRELYLRVCQERQSDPTNEHVNITGNHDRCTAGR